MIIVVDTDAFIGTLSPQDIHHLSTRQILLKLADNNVQFIYPATTIVETITFLQGRLNSPELADQVLKLVNTNQLIVEPVDDELIQRASLFMDFKSSKHNTLFDAVVAATAQKYHADAIFSFDKFYKTKGFKLASEL